MKLFIRRILLFTTFLATGVGFLLWHKQPPRTNTPLAQQAYVWQRAWTPSVQDAVRISAPNLSAYVVLGAEVSFRSGRFDVARVALNYASLKSARRPVGIALRIGPYHGVFGSSDQTVTQLQSLAQSLIDEATAAGVKPAELQIDFDCAESSLEGYRLWVAAIRRQVAPIPVTITALPSWLKRSTFAALAHASEGYVLQVHSLERPTSIDSPMTLCDPEAARKSVELAGRIGVPFRVALPTYSYLVAFDARGTFAGLSAEGPSKSWGADTQVRTLAADPAAMAGLVAGWNADHPQCLSGIIWYRLPTAEDSLNWRLATLQSVMAGRVPSPKLCAEVRKTEPRLFEVQLLNEGEADAPLSKCVTLRWQGASLVAADGLGGFEHTAQNSELTMKPTPALTTQTLAPGDHRAIGWLRLSDDKEVVADVSSIEP